MARVLIIDDDPLTCEALSELVRNIGHSADSAGTKKEGLQKAMAGDYDVVFQDVRLPDGNGLDMVPQLKEGPMPPEVIILTGAGDPDGAALAIRNGAWDYLQKPLSPKKILLPLKRVLKYRDTLRLKSAPPVDFKRCGIVGDSPALHRVLEKVSAASRSDAGVLITGETGTGKELFARAVHENSNRSNGPFVVVDCASIPANLLESTLFGHVKGAFTGRTRQAPASSKRPTAEPCSWTRSGKCPLICKRSCCAFCRSGATVPWAAARRSRATSGWSRPPTATWRPWWIRANSGATCCTAWAS